MNLRKQMSVKKIEKALSLPLSEIEKELIRWINVQINNGVDIYKEDDTTKQEEIKEALYSCYNALDDDKIEDDTDKIYKKHIDKILKIFKEETNG